MAQARRRDRHDCVYHFMVGVDCVPMGYNRQGPCSGPGRYLSSPWGNLDRTIKTTSALDGDRKVARVTGLEPATSGVTGRHPNQLSYTRWRDGGRLGEAPQTVNTRFHAKSNFSRI